MAMDKDGKFLAMRVHTDANLGAYLSTFSTAVPTILYATLPGRQYTCPQIYVEVDAWFTNTAPVDAYRGAAVREATYLLERLVSRCGVRTGHRRKTNIRKRNFITQLALPDAGGLAIRRGRLPRLHGQRPRFWATTPAYAARKAASAAKGLLRGIGVLQLHRSLRHCA
jgi:carbon-monoxide dehydrogenase large subunit